MKTATWILLLLHVAFYALWFSIAATNLRFAFGGAGDPARPTDTRLGLLWWTAWIAGTQAVVPLVFVLWALFPDLRLLPYWVVRIITALCLGAFLIAIFVTLAFCNRGIGGRFTPCQDPFWCCGATCLGVPNPRWCPSAPCPQSFDLTPPAEWVWTLIALAVGAILPYILWGVEEIWNDDE